MNRRSALLGICAAAGAAAIGEASAPTPKHFLDSISSEEIERIIRYSLGDQAWNRFRNRVSYEGRKARNLSRIERRGENSVLWRGIVTEQLPESLLAHDHTAPNRRGRDVQVYKMREPLLWQGVELPAGSKILIDSRCPDDLANCGGEVIQTPKGIRAHVWPKAGAENV